MEKKKNLMWSLSLTTIGITSIILNGSNIFGLELPDLLTRALGIINLIAIPVLIYSTVKRLKKEK
ncbi:MAG: hypothetical protein IJ346_01225 [Clostridia bacterium]|nr:hypothetical protein [Clostridia bacterium]